MQVNNSQEIQLKPIKQFRFDNADKAKSLGRLLSIVIPTQKLKNMQHENPAERLARIIKVAEALYDDMRWYHGTSLLNKRNIEAEPSKNEKGGFEAPIQNELYKNRKINFIYVSKDFKLACMYGFGESRHESDSKKTSGIVRIFGTADDLKLKWYQHGFRADYREVKRTAKKPTFKSILTQDESPAIKALFYKNMKKRITDITVDESDLSLKRVRSFEDQDFVRWNNDRQRP